MEQQNINNSIQNKKSKSKKVGWRELDLNTLKKENDNKQNSEEEIFCKLFLNDKCKNNNCPLIHNFSLKYKKENNSQFKENLKILSEDYHLIKNCEEIKLKEKSLSLQNIVIVYNRRRHNIYAMINKEITRILLHVNKNYDSIEMATKVVYEDYTNMINCLYEEFSDYIYFFTVNKLILSAFMRLCLKFQLNIESYDFIENENEFGLYCLLIQEKELKLLKMIMKEHFRNISKDSSFFLFIRNSGFNLNQKTTDTEASITNILKLTSNFKEKTEYSKEKMENLIKRITPDVSDYNSILESKENEKEIKLQLEETKPPLNWEKLSNVELECICHTSFIKKDRNITNDWANPLIQKSKINSKVLIADNPFSKGSMRYAFYMYDTYLNQKLVAKVPIFISDKNYTLSTLSKDIESIIICQYLADCFNDKVINIVNDTSNLLNFVNCFLYEIITPDKTNFKFFQVENFIDGTYEKYNNNFGWINNNNEEYSLIAQTFSHFSWQFTKGYLLVNDLQGVKGVLTDPQIHCLNIKKYGAGNLGYLGMLQFFNTHMCNVYCDKLNLLHPKGNIEINENFDFFVDLFIPPKDANEKILKLCELCKKPYKVSASILYKFKKLSKELYCHNCENNRVNTQKKEFCKDCNKQFFFSVFWFKMRRTAFPVRCCDCRLYQRNKLRDGLTLSIDN